MQVHACLLALRTGKPVKMVYTREESFFGHVHRHPARMRYEHGADPRRPAGLRQGRRSCSTAARTRPARAAVVGQRGHAGRRARTRCRTCAIDATASTPTTRRAGRCAASARCRRASRYESQMDKLAAALGLDPVELRLPQRDDRGLGACRPARWSTAPAPVAELLRRLQACRCHRRAEPATGPARAARRRRQHHPRRGRRARRRLRRRHQEHLLLRGLRRLLHRAGAAGGDRRRAGGARCTPPPPRSARAWSPSQAQIARTELGVERVTVAPADTAVGSAPGRRRRPGRRT